MDTSAPEGATAEYTQLIALAVHEMRTPASVVGGYLRMLQMDTGTTLGERQQRMITEAEKSCARLVEILGELSELGKLDAGAAVMKTETFDLLELISEVAKTVPAVPDREVHLETRGLDSKAPLAGDRTRLRKVLDVVIRAVMREQPSETRVVADVRVIRGGGKPVVRLIVSPEPDLERAGWAEPAPIDDRRGGLGLGLPLARRIIERHGGRIWSPATESGRVLPIGSRGAIVLSLPLSG